MRIQASSFHGTLGKVDKTVSQQLGTVHNFQKKPTPDAHKVQKCAATFLFRK